MPNRKKYKLGDVVDSVSITHKFPIDKIIFLNTSDILEGEVLHTNYSEVHSLPGQAKKSIKKGDILFSEIRPGNKRYAFVDFDADNYVVSTKLMVLRKKSDLVDYTFFYKWLTSEPILNEFQNLAESRSGTFPQITFDVIKNIVIDGPPEKESQTRIASILSALDDKIELNRRTNQTLEAMAQTLFKKYFVTDIDPDNLPDGWRWGKLGDVTLRITKGTTPTTLKKQFVSSGINFLKVENLNDNGTYDLSKMNFIDEETDALLSRSRIQENDILFSIAGTLGRAAFVNKEILPANTNQALAIIRPDTNITKPLFIYYWLKLPEVRENIFSNSVQGVQANLSLGVLSDVEIIIPPKAILENVFKLIDSLFNRVQRNESENSFLSKIRDSLLPKLMNGEIEVN